MEDVRKTAMERAVEQPAREQMKTDVGGMSAHRGSERGGDRIDPRLFYFRALLESDRFFGDGRRS